MEKFKNSFLLELNEGTEETLITEANKRVKQMKRDVGTNNFRGAVQSLLGLLQDYIKND